MYNIVNSNRYCDRYLKKGLLDILIYVSYIKYVNINGQFNIYFFLMIILIKLLENVEIHLL